MFKLSKPTCDEMEQIKSGGYATTEYDKEKEAIVNHQGKVEGYEYSSFGYLEKRLNDKNLFPLYPIEDR